MRRFLKAKEVPVPIKQPPVLIIDGPYAHTGNPMMTGILMMLPGIGVLSGSISFTFIRKPLFVSISILEFRHMEGPELKKRLQNIKGALL